MPIASGQLYPLTRPVLTGSGGAFGSAYMARQVPVFSSAVNLDTSLAGQLTKNGVNSAWDAGCISTKSFLDTATDNYVEFQAGQANRFFMLGVGIGNTNEDYGDIDAAFFCNNAGNFTLYYQGGLINTFADEPYTTSTIFRVGLEITGSEKRYVWYRDDRPCFCQDTSASGSILLDCSFYSPGALATNIKLVGADWT